MDGVVLELGAQGETRVARTRGKLYLVEEEWSVSNEVLSYLQLSPALSLALGSQQILFVLSYFRTRQYGIFY